MEATIIICRGNYKYELSVKEGIITVSKLNGEKKILFTNKKGQMDERFVKLIVALSKVHDRIIDYVDDKGSNSKGV